MKLNKIGLWFLIIHSFIVVSLTIIDVMSAVGSGSSGFALIPITMLDFTILPISDFFDHIFPTLSSTLNNTIYIILQKAMFAVPFLIFGGVQYYLIGWAISKFLRLFKKSLPTA